MLPLLRYAVLLLLGGLVLGLPQVAMWRPMPRTPMDTGLYWLTGATGVVGITLFTTGALAIGLALARRLSGGRLRFAPVPRALPVGLGLVVLQVLVAVLVLPRTAGGPHGFGYLGYLTQMLSNGLGWVGTALLALWVAGMAQPRPQVGHLDSPT